MNANYFVRPQSCKTDEVNALGMQDRMQGGQKRDRGEEQRLEDEEQVMKDGSAGIEVEKRQKVSRRESYGGSSSSKDVQASAAARAAGAETTKPIDCEGEKQRVKAARTPGQPTAEEKAVHNVTHCPYRSWCRFCVAARGVESPHHEDKSKEEETMTLISFDYGYVKDSREATSERPSKMLTILAGYDSMTNSVMGLIVPAKGSADPWVVKRVATWIEGLGHEHIRIRVDKESPILAMAKGIKQERGGEEGRTVLEPAKQGDKKANGAAERAVRTVKDMFRTLKVALEHHIRSVIPSDADILKWMIEHAAYLHNRLEVGSDGRTAMERTRGKSSKVPLCGFGEQVLYLPLKAGRGGDLEPKFHVGLFVGVLGAEFIVLTEGGALRAHSVRRLPEKSQYDKDKVIGFKGTPWAPRDGEKEEPIPATTKRHENPLEVGEEGQKSESDRRRLRLEKSDFAKHGWTPGCRGCINRRDGKASGTHTEECRARMEKEIAKTEGGKARVGTVYERIDEAAASKAAASISKNEREEPQVEEEPRGETRKEAESEEEPNEEDKQETKRRRVEETGDMQSMLMQVASKRECERARAATKQAEDVGAEWILDLTGVDDEGYDWNLDDDAMRRKAMKAVIESRPKLVIGSVKRTQAKTEKDERSQIRDMISRADFCSALYELQVRCGRYVLHEDPAEGRAWDLPCMKRVRDMIGMGSDSAEVMRNSRFMTNSSEIMKRVKTCDKSSGETVTNKGYPSDLCKAVRQGVKSQAAKDAKVRCMRRDKHEVTRKASEKLNETLARFQLKLTPSISTQIDPQERRESEESLRRISRLMHVDEREEDELMTVTTSGEYVDDVKGGVLDKDKVIAAREDEMGYVRKHKLYDRVPRSECVRVTGKQPLKTGWVDTNKGNENYRSRWVAKEFKRYNDTELFAATPPLEALRLILSRGASAGRQDTCFGVIDVRRAYFYAPARRAVYVELPWEDWQEGDEGMCARLNGSLYGTRDAARNWDAEISKSMKEAGFVKGEASTCVYHHPARDIVAMVHGDDISMEGRRNDVEAIVKFMKGKYEIKSTIIGMQKDLAKEVKILNRTVGICSRGYYLQADRRHGDILVKDLGLEKSNPCATPEAEESRLKAKDEEEEIDKDSQKAEDIRRFRGLSARLNYLSLDRPSLKRASARVASGMANPQPWHWEALKRVGRYIKGRPAETLWYAWQRPTELVKTFTDSDWGGCQRTRRSTSGGCIMRGQHLIKSWSKAQHAVSLSSAEAELYAAIRAGTEMIGVVAIMKDLSMGVIMSLAVDATAAIGMLSREGLGRSKHVDVQFRWLQEKVRDKVIRIVKVASSENPADLFTKPLTERENMQHLARMGVEAGWAN